VASVQNRLPAGDDRQDAVLAVCERQGIPFLPWFPLGAGRLARGGRDGLDGPGTPAQRAIAWLLRRSPVMLPIPGTSSLAHLEENVGAVDLLEDAR
jgi:aryl-alcohol dehydrogenase-like predicted oxidoreductase